MTGGSDNLNLLPSLREFSNYSSPHKVIFPFFSRRLIEIPFIAYEALFLAENKKGL
jgi:hypothetical protein